MDEISILLKQNRLASYLRSIVGSNCSIGLHEINDCYHKREKAQHIMTSGLKNIRGGTTYFNVSYFGKSGFDDMINHYNYYGSNSLKTIIVVAIPEFFVMSDNSICYGGIFNKRYCKDDEGYPECLTDYTISLKVPPEFILGYYTYDSRDIKPIYKQETRTICNPTTGEYATEIVNRCVGYQEADVVFYSNPRYYNKLSQMEKDDFIRKYFKEIFFNIRSVDSIKEIEVLSNFLISMDEKQVFLSNTIKQAQSSKLLSDYLEDKIPGFHVVSRKY